MNILYNNSWDKNWPHKIHCRVPFSFFSSTRTATYSGKQRLLYGSSCSSLATTTTKLPPITHTYALRAQPH